MLSNSNMRPIMKQSPSDHPEASPGPSDSHYLFRRFAELIETPAA